MAGIQTFLGGGGGLRTMIFRRGNILNEISAFKTFVSYLAKVKIFKLERWLGA